MTPVARSLLYFVASIGLLSASGLAAEEAAPTTVTLNELEVDRALLPGALARCGSSTGVRGSIAGVREV
jgi:hypothetical protein